MAQDTTGLPVAVRETPSGPPPPLVVELEGTLLRTTLSSEAANDVLARRPLRAARIALRTRGRRLDLQHGLATEADVDVDHLPIDEQVLDFVLGARDRGSDVVLASAGDPVLTARLARRFHLSEDVVAGPSRPHAAVDMADRLVERFGAAGYDYLGSGTTTTAVWREAGHGYLVSAARTDGSGPTTTEHLTVIPLVRRSRGRSLLRALRTHQWLKNLLVFLPLGLAGAIADGVRVLHGIEALVLFSLLASSLYMLNDLVDVGNDRHHHRKRFRPFAAGDLSLRFGWTLWPLLLVGTALASWLLLPLRFLLVLGVYAVVTLAYSFVLKQRAIIDVLALAGLYTVRIVAGAAAVSVPLSFWLLTFSTFFFLSLALIKRFSELRLAQPGTTATPLRGRGYSAVDRELVSSLGVAAGYLSVLVFALYINDPRTAQLYASPKFLWIVEPVLLYWLSRAWLITHRGHMHDDPVIFAIKDRRSPVLAAICVLAFVLAKVVT